jgi:hypothetical protein
MPLYSDIKCTPVLMVRHYVQKHYGCIVVLCEKEPELGKITLVTLNLLFLLQVHAPIFRH